MTLRYDPATGKLLYHSATGALMSECCCVEPCEYCATGTTPSQITLTFTGVQDCGIVEDCDATAINDTFVVPRDPALTPCDFKLVVPNLFGAHDAWITAHIVDIEGTTILGVSASGMGGPGKPCWIFHGPTDVAEKEIVDDDCSNLPTPLANRWEVGDCGEEFAMIQEGYGGEVAVEAG